MICQDSLSRTLDAVDEHAFDNRTLPLAERTRVAQWIAGRQGLPGTKSGTFAGFAAELREGVVAFTGERFTHASARHILVRKRVAYSAGSTCPTPTFKRRSSVPMPDS